MKIIFIDKNRALTSKVKKAVKALGLDEFVTVKTGDIFKEKGVLVTASNPSFSMGGGLDAQIAKRYPDICSKVKKEKGNQRIDNIILTITVDDKIAASKKLVNSALKFALDSTKKTETVLISGLGTGIGGYSENDFVYSFITAIMNKNKLRWKFFNDGWKSQHGNDDWGLNKWNSVRGAIKLCENGYHCSALVSQSMGYLASPHLAMVQGRGDSDISDDKEAYRQMQVIKKFTLSPEKLVGYAIFGAELVLHYFEENYPDDDRPRKALEAARNYLKIKAAAAAARAAYAAEAAAADAAAAGAARAAAARAARAAAYAAADAAAADAAAAAAIDGIYKKLDQFFILEILCGIIE